MDIWGSRARGLLKREPRLRNGGNPRDGHSLGPDGLEQEQGSQRRACGGIDEGPSTARGAWRFARRHAKVQDDLGSLARSHGAKLQERKAHILPQNEGQGSTLWPSNLAVVLHHDLCARRDRDLTCGNDDAADAVSLACGQATPGEEASELLCRIATCILRLLSFDAEGQRRGTQDARRGRRNQPLGFVLGHDLPLVLRVMLRRRLYLLFFLCLALPLRGGLLRLLAVVISLTGRAQGRECCLPHFGIRMLEQIIEHGLHLLFAHAAERDPRCFDLHRRIILLRGLLLVFRHLGICFGRRVFRLPSASTTAVAAVVVLGGGGAGLHGLDRRSTSDHAPSKSDLLEAATCRVGVCQRLRPASLAEVKVVQIQTLEPLADDRKHQATIAAHTVMHRLDRLATKERSDDAAGDVGLCTDPTRCVAVLALVARLAQVKIVCVEALVPVSEDGNCLATIADHVHMDLDLLALLFGLLFAQFLNDLFRHFLEHVQQVGLSIGRDLLECGDELGQQRRHAVDFHAAFLQGTKNVNESIQ
mmetsp:Transcript_71541/g.232526  ORF Transcript_71541/g.232526 Transcript_71541/m.232526 type:complete len:532 (-) Transcript_71541:601-2196(-)